MIPQIIAKNKYWNVCVTLYTNSTGISLNKLPVTSLVIVYAMYIPTQQYAIFDKIVEEPSRNDFSTDKTSDANGDRKSSVIPKT